MTDTLKAWAVTERQFLKDQIMWFKAGSKLISPGGKDVTAQKVDELEKRLEHANKVLGESID